MSEGEKIIEIPLDQILEPEEQVRASVDEEELEALANSLKLIGQIEPIKVKKKGKKYLIIDGFMRTLSAKSIGWTTIKAIVQTSTEEIESAIKVHANIFRVTQDPLGEAEYFSKKMVDWGVTIPELARRLRVPESRVRDRLSLLELPDDLKEALAQRKIGLGVAKQFAKLENEGLRRQLINRAEEWGLTEKGAENWVAQYRNLGREEPPPSEKEIEEKAKEMEEFYLTPCEVCGEKQRIGDMDTISGHSQCIADIRKAILIEREASKKQQEEKPPEE
jgi:ParB family chromosome partitioning protein